MRLRLTLTLFLLAGISGSLLSGCDSIQNAIYKSAIEKAIHEDSLTGTDPSDSHVNAMSKVDLSDCPPEFREAYSKHIHAWEERAAVQKAKAKLDNDEDAAAVGGLLASLFDSQATPWSDHMRAVQEVNRLDSESQTDVQTTWQSVEDVARKYGVQM